MSDLYLRSGALFTGTVHDATSRPYAIVTDPCHRCGGQGGSDAWRFTGWTCYRCAGGCLEAPRRVPLYSSERLARLDATLAKRTAVKTAKLDAQRALVRAAADARRDAFQARHADVLAWLARAGLDQDGNPRDGFLGDMLTRARQYCEWTEGQESAVYASCAKAQVRDVVRAASRHVGQTGERIEVTATVERESTYERRRFGYDRESEIVYITTMRDAAGNTIVVKSPAFRARVGATVTVRGTVREHSDYRGEAQTVLQRVAMLAEVLPVSEAA